MFRLFGNERLFNLKPVYCVTLALAAVLMTSPSWAQQSGKVDDWKAEYAARIKSTLESRRAQKPNFLKDVQTSKPDFIVYIPKVEPENLGDCYNDHFQVFDGPNGKLFATVCQATCEGALDQHIALLRSDDCGKTWSDPKVLAGPKTFDSNVPKEVENIGTYYIPSFQRGYRWTRLQVRQLVEDLREFTNPCTLASSNPLLKTSDRL